MLWERFTNKTIDDQLWYYRALAAHDASVTGTPEAVAASGRR